MAHFARVRTSGQWVLGSTILDTELETIDGNLFKAINGDDGGTWNPSSQIVIGGQGLLVTGPLDVDGLATFEGAVAFQNDVDFNSGGAAVFNDTVEFGPSSTVAFSVAMTVNSEIILSGDGRVRSTVVTLADSDLVTPITAGDVYYLPASVPITGSSKVLRFTNAGASSGSRAVVSRADVASAFVLQVQDDGGGILVDLEGIGSTPYHCEVIHDGTDWKLLRDNS